MHVIASNLGSKTSLESRIKKKNPMHLTLYVFWFSRLALKTKPHDKIITLYISEYAPPPGPRADRRGQDGAGGQGHGGRSHPDEGQPPASLTTKRIFGRQNSTFIYSNSETECWYASQHFQRNLKYTAYFLLDKIKTETILSILLLEIVFYFIFIYTFMTFGISQS